MQDMTLQDALEFLGISNSVGVNLNEACSEKYNELKARYDNAFDEDIKEDIQQQLDTLEQVKKVITSLPSSSPNVNQGSEFEENSQILEAYQLLGLNTDSSHKAVIKAYQKKKTDLEALRKNISSSEGKLKVNKQLEILENAYLSLAVEKGIISENDKESLFKWLVLFSAIITIVIVSYLVYDQINELRDKNVNYEMVREKQQSTVDSLKKELYRFENKKMRIENAGKSPLTITKIESIYQDENGLFKHIILDGFNKIIQPNETLEPSNEEMGWDGSVISYLIFSGDYYVYGLWNSEDEGIQDGVLILLD